jgi:iron complex outermembrane recepter protein
LSVGGQALTVTQQAPVQQYLAGAVFAQAACVPLAAPTRRYRNEVCNDISNTSTDKMWGHNFQIQNDFDAFKVKLTSGYRLWNNSSNTDLDGIGAFTGPAFTSATTFNGFAGTPAAAFLPFVFPVGTPAATINFVAGSPVPRITQNLFDTNNVRKHRQFSNELEVSGDTDNLDWVVGGFYFWEKGSENNPQNSGFVLDTNAAVFSRFGALSPVFQASNPARYRLVQTRSILAYTAQAESTALYGQFTLYPG